ncbi:selenide, water dikinase SelD [Ligilactobacillus salivarius]|nr:selenide, water dikinase SelD [Ligilactobacillus salivarius]
MGPADLYGILEKLPQKKDENLLVGYNSDDDAAVYMINDTEAIIQTVDFFPPNVSDPYIFGKIAATNAVSDIFAMGGDVTLALNILAFPKNGDKDILSNILKGGQEVVNAAGGIIAGGHTISDNSVKYGLSVTGKVKLDGLIKNNTVNAGDHLILTKPLGVGIIVSAYNAGEATEGNFKKAVKSMTTLNRTASEVMRKYGVSACTDVTGFGLLGHLKEMLNDKFSAIVSVNKLPIIDGAYEYAQQFLTTGGGQKNREYLEDSIDFKIDDYAMEEILYDPQTSGGLLISISEDKALSLVKELREKGVTANDIGVITDKQEYSIKVN